MSKLCSLILRHINRILILSLSRRNRANGIWRSKVWKALGEALWIALWAVISCVIAVLIASLAWGLMWLIKPPGAASLILPLIFPFIILLSS